jgi:hypothetical protein
MQRGSLSSPQEPLIATAFVRPVEAWFASHMALRRWVWAVKVVTTGHGSLGRLVP